MRHNSFGALRLIAAILVLYTHAFPLALGARFHEPDIGLPFSLGTTGVYIFFAISGILVTKSFMQSENVIHFAIHRILRIFPALIVCVLLCAFVMGPLMTELALTQYSSDSGLVSFLSRNLFLLSDTQSSLPGVFVSNPYPSAGLDPIWTLPWELRSYFLLALGGVLFSMKRYPQASLVLFLLAALNAIFLMDVSKPSLFFLLFALGGALYLSNLRGAMLGGLIAVLTVFVAVTHGTPMFEVFFCGWIAVLVYAIGFSTWLASSTLEKYDLSYGIYIYSFPVGQLLVSILGIRDPWLLLIVNLAMAALLALLSWIYIEKPALRKKTQASECLSGWLTGRNLIGSKQ